MCTAINQSDTALCLLHLVSYLRKIGIVSWTILQEVFKALLLTCLLGLRFDRFSRLSALGFVLVQIVSQISKRLHN